jgi:hypothetical protein
MSLVRIVALTISDEVVRWASPGCKEWAEGLEREARVIENDWAALRWSIGSMRVLLDRRAVPLTSLDEVPAATQKFVETTRWQAGFVLAMSIMQGLINLLPFFLARIILRPAGCAIVVLASILTGTYSFMERRRLKEPWKDDIYDDLLACTSFYKEQLKRLDSIWIYFSLWFCMTLNYYMHDNDEFYLWLFACMFLFTFSVTQQRKQNNLRRIEEIDALLAGRE